MFSALTILTLADDGSKQPYINNENCSDKKKNVNSKENISPPKKDFIITSENLNITPHSKFPVSILKNPYYPPHVILIRILHPLEI